MSRNNGRNTDGRFAPGNPGRPKGSRNKTTAAISALLDGEAEAITRKAVEMALEGDSVALRLCLERIAPPRKDTPVEFVLPPIQSMSDAAIAGRFVLAAVAEGALTPLEAAHVMALIETYRKLLEFSEFEERLTKLESSVA